MTGSLPFGAPHTPLEARTARMRRLPHRATWMLVALLAALAVITPNFGAFAAPSSNVDAPIAAGPQAPTTICTSSLGGGFEAKPIQQGHYIWFTSKFKPLQTGF